MLNEKVFGKCFNINWDQVMIIKLFQGEFRQKQSRCFWILLLLNLTPRAFKIFIRTFNPVGGNLWNWTSTYILPAVINKLLMLGLVERLKNSDFILESKTAEINQNKKSKRRDWPDAGWKLYFILETNQ